MGERLEESAFRMKLCINRLYNTGPGGKGGAGQDETKIGILTFFFSDVGLASSWKDNDNYQVHTYVVVIDLQDLFA